MTTSIALQTVGVSTACRDAMASGESGLFISKRLPMLDLYEDG
jgi:hypothetical protein